MSIVLAVIGICVFGTGIATEHLSGFILCMAGGFLIGLAVAVARNESR